jgi:hypothetical protein
MSNKDRPCKGCKKRYVGCHSRCKEYADAERANAGKRAVEKRARDEDRIMAEYVTAARLRCSAK